MVTQDPALQALLEAIHATPTKVVIALAGGATQSIGWCLSVPGASNTVLEARPGLTMCLCA